MYSPPPPPPRAPSPPPSMTSNFSESSSSSSSSSPAMSFEMRPFRLPTWSWRCPRCAFSYRVSATVRCLECGQRLGRRLVRRTTTDGAVLQLQDATDDFDIDGWAAQRNWARTTREIAAEAQVGRGEALDRPPRPRPSCYLDCAHPGECYLAMDPVPHDWDSRWRFRRYSWIR
ncbi:uncharacterized protein MAM_07370 [Metarhizium album ARSEF 1941]|uniref:Uncharacterized protein n=1 Tax=Metarhizium album (strain ARSEF 1941) TaxID=1081103 RepID=A0A0B2WMA2_METAS|nr:uncharacterized protein MAM_07370 [Metarhizium album ARSEF 1941]KHN94774.1 hypothetical protein MAM_07370 [Metarhizium album ARSEF 1941]